MSIYVEEKKWKYVRLAPEKDVCVGLLPEIMSTLAFV
jgi:hypothetical protein